MADRPRFGPAGVPPTFIELKASLADVPRLLRKKGLTLLSMKPSIGAASHRSVENTLNSYVQAQGRMTFGSACMAPIL